MEREFNLKNLSKYLDVTKDDLIKILREMREEKQVVGFFDSKSDTFFHFKDIEVEGIISRLNKIKFSISNLPQLISEMIPNFNLSATQCSVLLNALLEQGNLRGFFTNNKDEFLSLNYLLEFLLQIFWNEGKISIDISKKMSVSEKSIHDAIAHLQSTNKIQGVYIKNNKEFISKDYIKLEVLKLIEDVPGITIPLIANKLGLDTTFIEKIFDDLVYDGSILMRQSITGSDVEYLTKSKVREEIIKSVSLVHRVQLTEIAERLRVQYQIIFDMFNQLISQGKIKGYIDSYSGDFVVETSSVEVEEPILSPSDAILIIENISVQGRGKLILQSVSVALEHKGILGIIGESGTGKSTFLKAIIGQMDVIAGNILIVGYQPKDSEIANVMGYVPQDLSKIYPNFTCLENMEHFGKQYGLNKKEIKQRSEKIFKDLKISNLKNELVKNLSGGERRRASIAIAMIHNPKILFLDEPTSGLDPVLRKELWNMLSNLNEEYGTSLVVVTHYPEEGQFCSKICMFAKDRGIVSVGNPRKLVRNLPGGGRVIILELRKPFSKVKEYLSKISGIDYILEERKNEKFRIFSINPMRSIVKEITSAIKMTDIQNISQGEANMTDFFRIKLLQ